MSVSTELDKVLVKATQLENEFNWAGAVDVYQKSRDIFYSHDSLVMAQLEEHHGYALCRTAMQSEDRDTFQARMNQAIDTYEKASLHYGILTDQARRLRCSAMIELLRFWLSGDTSERRKHVGEAWRRAKETVRLFQEAGESAEFGRTINQLSLSVALGMELELDFHERKKLLTEVIMLAERSAEILESLQISQDAAIAHVKAASYLTAYGYFIAEPFEKEAYYARGLDHWKCAHDLSATTSMIARSHFENWYVSVLLDLEEDIAILLKALPNVRETKDRVLIGSALDEISNSTRLKAQATTDDPDERMALFKRSREYAEEAVDQYAPLQFTSPRAMSMGSKKLDSEDYWTLAGWETDLRKKRELLEEGRRVIPEYLMFAQDSGYPQLLWGANHGSSKALASLARLERDNAFKKELLDEALKYRNESIRLSEQLHRTSDYDRGLNYNYLSEIKTELAQLEPERGSQQRLIREAIGDLERGVRLGLKTVEQERIRPRVAVVRTSYLAQWQSRLGDLLSRLHGLTHEQEHLREAAEAFTQAAQSFMKPGLPSRASECFWRAGEAYSNLGKHLQAAESFDQAYRAFLGAAEKIPQLGGLYRDYASYMQAWSEIEKARDGHKKQKYDAAKRCYRNAGELLKSTSHWNYLSLNFFAWAKLEEAEELSAKRQGPDAIKVFGEAAHLFGETENVLAREHERIDNQNEKREVASLRQAAALRQKYCAASIALEEGKILDREGDREGAAENYGKVAETLNSMVEVLDSESDQIDVRRCMKMAKGFEMMKRAEIEIAPEMYDEAARSFEEAGKLSSSEHGKLFAHAQVRFCKALEAGAQFEDSREPSLHRIATRHLEGASNYYLKSGFKDASEYAEATKLLLDAYLYMDEASKESDHDKKAKLWLMAERVLKSSASFFEKAGYHTRGEQLHVLLGKVREEREMAISLSEILQSPSTLTLGAEMTTPTLTQESAVGVERFDRPEVQMTLLSNKLEVKVGEDCELEIELVNAGKKPAQLVRIDDVAPKGFEIAELSHTFRVEENRLNLKGKHLDPLKKEEVRLVLRPKARGSFLLKPKLRYLDESGGQMESEAKGLEVTVKELGVSGWIKGK